jgi:hypothetical protein
VDYRLNIQRDYFKKSDKEGLDYYNKRNDVFKKIILTTDQDLIADGVQEIDDEFLEWFVNNPGCESVEIEVEKVLNQGSYITGNIVTKSEYKIIIPQEEPKKETLEEAAERYSNNFTGDEGKFAIEDFINGAKYQAEKIGLMEIELNHTKTLLASCEKALEDRDKKAERMYSEDKVIILLNKFGGKVYDDYTRNQTMEDFTEEWFEQYKKK